jgi:TRAP-type C4-dicarboxylate transport system substrate-binding protein
VERHERREAESLPIRRRQGIAWSTAEHLKKEAELADGFKKQGLEVYTPDVNAFRTYAQKIYLASDEAKAWPPGLLEKINALKT